MRLLLLQNRLTPSSFINNPNAATELPNQLTNLNLSNIQPSLPNFVKTETHSQSVILPKQSNVPAVPTIPVKNTQNLNKLPTALANKRPVRIIEEKKNCLKIIFSLFFVKFMFM